MHEINLKINKKGVGIHQVINPVKRCTIQPIPVKSFTLGTNKDLTNIFLYKEIPNPNPNHPYLTSNHSSSDNESNRDPPKEKILVPMLH